MFSLFNFCCSVINEHPKEELTTNDNLFLKPVIKDKIKNIQKKTFLVWL